jgi:hypothetical protein
MIRKLEMLAGSGWRRHALAAALLLPGLFFFVPNLSGYFVADDFVLLSWTHVSAPGEVASFFDPGSWWFYRPLVKVAYWLGQGLFGLHPVPFHLVSLLLHWANAFLVYLLVTLVTDGRWSVGLITGLLFLLNPHHAETVSWFAAIGDLLAAACILGSLSLFRQFYLSGRTRFGLGSVGLFALGVLARETAVLLPGILLLEAGLIRLLRSRPPASPRSPGRWAAVAGSFALVLMGYVLLQVAGRAAGTSELERGGLQFHALNLESILLGVLDYVNRLVPGGTVIVDQPLEVLRGLVYVEWLGIVLLAALLVWKRRYVALFGLAWMLSAPLLFVFFSGPADRYFYLPGIGYAIFAAALIVDIATFASARVQSRRATQVVWGAAGAIVLGLLVAQSVKLLERGQSWKSAGKITGGIVHDMRQAVPEAEDYAKFYFVGLPPAVMGVPLFGDGLGQAVQLAYGDNRTISAATTTCAELQTAELPSRAYLFEFKGDGVRLLAEKQECR